MSCQLFQVKTHFSKRTLFFQTFLWKYQRRGSRNLLGTYIQYRVSHLKMLYQIHAYIVKSATLGLSWLHVEECVVHVRSIKWLRHWTPIISIIPASAPSEAGQVAILKLDLKTLKKLIVYRWGVGSRKLMKRLLARFSNRRVEILMMSHLYLMARNKIV